MTYNELMIRSLSGLTEGNEILKYPIYGTFLQKNRRWFGYFGVTSEYLLIALLEGSFKKIAWTSRIPLDIKAVRVKKCWMPYQYKVLIQFHEGMACKLRVSEKVYGIKSQEENLPAFIKLIQDKATTVPRHQGSFFD